MAEYSFPHTSVGGDRVVSAAMWRAANRSLGMDGWAYGLAATRNSPTGAVFTVSAGALALDGVVYQADDDVTVTGTVVAGINAIIAKFGTDRNIELAHVLDYLNSPPAYDHVLLYLDSQVATFTLIDKRADSSIMPLQDRDGTVADHNIVSMSGSKLTGTVAASLVTGELGTSQLAADSVTRDILADTAMQSGLINNDGNFVQGTTYTRTITFATPFAATPNVVATMGGTDPSAWAGPSVTDIGTTSFKVHYKRLGSSGSFTANIYWIATPRTQTTTI